MSRPNSIPQNHAIELGVEEMNLETIDTHRRKEQGEGKHPASSSSSRTSSSDAGMEVTDHSPIKNGTTSEASTPAEKDHEVVGGEVTISQEPGQPPKLSRTSTKKVKARPSPLFLDAKDCTSESQTHFETMTDCSYINRYIGSTEHGSMDCDCVEEWGRLLSLFSCHNKGNLQC